MVTYDVAIIGGGIIGSSAALYLGQAGLSVVLVESERIAAGASGRNSGAIQHPFDPPLAGLHRRSLELYRELAAEAEFDMPSRPAGLLLVSDDRHAAQAAQAELAGAAPELQPTFLDSAQLQQLEPSLSTDLVAVRVDTAYPVAPEAATLGIAAAALRVGVHLRVGNPAALEIASSKASGLRLASGELVAAGTVVVAAGPSTSALLGPGSGCSEISSMWGVVATIDLPQAPRHVIEELGIDRPGRPPEHLFSLITAEGRTGLGSTFLPLQPQASDWTPALVERGRRYVPNIGSATVSGLRSCARPVTGDGRPLIGRVPRFDNVFVCAGHGPWGISTGPASARSVVDQLLGQQGEQDVFSPARTIA